MPLTPIAAIINTTLPAPVNRIIERGSGGTWSEMYPGSGPGSTQTQQKIIGFTDGTILVSGNTPAAIWDFDPATGVYTLEHTLPTAVYTFGVFSSPGRDPSTVWTCWTPSAGGNLGFAKRISGSWTSALVPGTSAYLPGIWAASDQIAWLVDRANIDNAEIRLTVDGGTTWLDMRSQMASDVPQWVLSGFNRDVPQGLWGFAANDVYFYSGNGRLVRWDGSNFSLVTDVGYDNQTYPRFHAMAGFEKGGYRILIAGATASPGPSTYIDRFVNGVHTRVYTTAEWTGATSMDIACADDGSWCGYVIAQSRTYESTDDGLTWAQADASFPQVWPTGRGWGIGIVGEALLSPRRQPVVVSIEDGYGAGFSLAYDGYNFVPPYNAAGSEVVAVDIGGGVTAYDFKIEKQSLWTDNGQIGIRAEVPDGYDGPTNRSPLPGSEDKPRNEIIEFRVTESE